MNRSNKFEKRKLFGVSCSKGGTTNVLNRYYLSKKQEVTYKLFFFMQRQEDIVELRLLPFWFAVDFTFLHQKESVGFT